MKPLTISINKHITMIPMNVGLNYFWNFGFILGALMALQTISGMVMTCFYSCMEEFSFDSIFYTINEIYFGWLYHSIHSIGVSLIFIFLYLHMLRSIYYKLFNNSTMWLSGMMMFILLITISFLGYVLPWNQMSYWAAKVITSLLTIIPFIGLEIVHCLWGNYTVTKNTLQRFFSLHTIIPIILWVVIMMHIILLHQSGSNNKFGLESKVYLVPMFPYYILKDLYLLLFVMSIFTLLIFNHTYLFLDSDSFMKSNKLMTPNHIKPDWFLLWAYAILRSIESKLGGVLCLIVVFIIFFSLKLTQSFKTVVVQKLTMYLFTIMFILLSLCGGMLLEYPFIWFSKMMTWIFIINMLML